ncbi:MAG: putative membrane protein [Bacteriovoracaceae bacterium]
MIFLDSLAFFFEYVFEYWFGNEGSIVPFGALGVVFNPQLINVEKIEK